MAATFWLVTVVSVSAVLALECAAGWLLFSVFQDLRREGSWAQAAVVVTVGAWVVVASTMLIFLALGLA